MLDEKQLEADAPGKGSWARPPWDRNHDWSMRYHECPTVHHRLIHRQPSMIKSIEQFFLARDGKPQCIPPNIMTMTKAAFQQKTDTFYQEEKKGVHTMFNIDLIVLMHGSNAFGSMHIQVHF